MRKHDPINLCGNGSVCVIKFFIGANSLASVTNSAKYFRSDEYTISKEVFSRVFRACREIIEFSNDAILKLIFERILRS